MACTPQVLLCAAGPRPGVPPPRGRGLQGPRARQRHGGRQRTPQTMVAVRQQRWENVQCEL